MADPITLGALAVKFGPSIVSGIGSMFGARSASKSAARDREIARENEQRRRFEIDREFSEKNRRFDMSQAEREGFRNSLQEMINRAPAPRANTSGNFGVMAADSPFSVEARRGIDPTTRGSIIDEVMGPQRANAPVQFSDAVNNNRVPEKTFEQMQAEEQRRNLQSARDIFAGRNNQLGRMATRAIDKQLSRMK